LPGTFYVTTPIYYPNDKPHIGHAYTTIMADVLARWHYLLGDDVFFLTGTDEHGLKLQRAAEKAGKDPKTFVDEMASFFKKYWSLLNIGYSRFIRTTDEDHVETVKRALTKIYKKGLIYKGVYRGWYCTSCEKFYGEGEYLEKDGQKFCPIHLKPLEWVEEETYFLKLSLYTEKILKLLETKDIIYPREYAREIISKLRREGLKDLSITRPKSRVYWGVEAPWDPNHTIYVWVDALLNYLTGIGWGRDEETFWKYWRSAHHIIGKDILWFHSAIWFSLLDMLDLPPPKKVIVHGFILVRGVKMSKTIGNVVRIEDLVNEYGNVDAVRYLLMRFSTLEKDMDYNPEQFRQAYNAELADTLGNLVRRVGVLAKRKAGGIVERPNSLDQELERKAKETLEKAKKLVDEVKLGEALVTIFDLLREANAYLNRTEPWKAENPAPILYNALEAIRIASIMLYPFMPATMERLANALGFKIESFDKACFGCWEKYQVKEAPILFPKLR